MSRFDVGVETEELPRRCTSPRAELYDARDVPLGGIRGMQVHRALPQRPLPTVGAWCFLDRFGPQEAVMRVEPHPHIGLQTVTWPFVGEVRHRDTLGNDVVVRRGVLNLMTSGAGIAHSEYSVGDSPVALDALQLWVALPESRRHGAPDFERVEDLPVVRLDAADHATGDAATAEVTVVLGEFAGVSSPARSYTPIVGAEIRLPAGRRVRVPLRPEWEHALVAITGEIVVEADPTTVVGPEQLLYLGIQRDHVEVAAESDTTLFLLGGEPFEADLVMWWNFVGRSHEEIAEAQRDWAEDSDRFGHVLGHGDERIPAPPMPTVRLTPRRRRR
ncbi:pirin family protein [Microbacterium gorillae]|uniref:pirin family protein n=1 Tax=Microbacterium gorillae TaxID=1231063 RepID=UPI00058E19BB|nr:pirin family protein [Microbacterium gorillae]